MEVVLEKKGRGEKQPRAYYRFDVMLARRHFLKKAG